MSATRVVAFVVNEEDHEALVRDLIDRPCVSGLVVMRQDPTPTQVTRAVRELMDERDGAL